MATEVMNLIYDATSKRQPDFLVATHLKNIINNNRDKENVILEVASVLLEQAFQGTIANSYVLSYLKYCLRAQLITPCSVFGSLPSFKAFDAPETLNVLLTLLGGQITEFSQSRADDPVPRLFQSVITLVTWLVNAVRHLLQRLQEQPELWARQGDNYSKVISYLHEICESKKFCSLLYIASIDEPEMWKGAAQSIEQLKAELTRVAEPMQLQQFVYELQNILKLMLSKFPFFEEHVKNLSRMLSENIKHESSVSALLPLEMILSAPNSVLYNSSNIENSFSFLREIQNVLNVSSSDVLRTIFTVCMTSVPLDKSNLLRCSAVMLIRVPQLVSLYLAQTGETINLFPLIVSFYTTHCNQIKRSQEMQILFISFLHVLVNQNSISNQDAAKLGYQGQTDMSKSLSVVHALFDKITNETRPLKVIDHLEKLTVDVDTLLYVGAAGGYLAKLVSMLVSISQQETSKDAIFGTCFLILFRIQCLFGNEPFRIISSQNPITVWLQTFFLDTKVKKYHEDPSPQQLEFIEQALTKLNDVPSRGADHAGPASSVLEVSYSFISTIITATSQGLCPEEKAHQLFCNLRDHSRTGFMACYLVLAQIASEGNSQNSILASKMLPLYKSAKLRSKLSTSLYHKNCLWIEEYFGRVNLGDDSKEKLQEIIKKLSVSLRPSQEQMSEIRRCASELGTKMFTRILTGSIMKQSRKDLSERACAVAIGASCVDWVGVPLSLIWYQVPEVMCAVEHASIADPFALFLATSLHFLSIYQRNKGFNVIHAPSELQKMFIEIAGKERSHFHGRSSDQRMLYTDIKDGNKAIIERLESLASIKFPTGATSNDPLFINNAFHSLGRTLHLSLTNSGPHLPIDFCMTLLDKIICRSLSSNFNIENVLNILQYLPFSFLNILLQISGINSNIPAVLLSVVDLQLPNVRTKVAKLIALGEARPLP